MASCLHNHNRPQNQPDDWPHDWHNDRPHDWPKLLGQGRFALKKNVVWHSTSAYRFNWSHMALEVLYNVHAWSWVSEVVTNSKILSEFVRCSCTCVHQSYSRVSMVSECFRYVFFRLPWVDTFGLLELGVGVSSKSNKQPELQNVKSFTRTKIVKPDFTPRKARE